MYRQGKFLCSETWKGRGETNRIGILNHTLTTEPDFGGLLVEGWSTDPVEELEDVDGRIAGGHVVTGGTCWSSW